MNVVQSNRPQKVSLGSVSPGVSSGPTVEFYNDIPDCELSLDDFEEFALARLKV